MTLIIILLILFSLIFGALLYRRARYFAACACAGFGVTLGMAWVWMVTK